MDEHTDLSQRIGKPIDAVPDGMLCFWTGTTPAEIAWHPLRQRDDGAYLPARDAATGEWYIGVQWDEPRDIGRVIVAVEGEDAALLRVEYWRHTWPTPAPERRPGARRGWIGQDDPWHGTWTRAQAAVTRQGTLCTATFDPLDITEVPPLVLEEAEDYAVSFRRTLKLRLILGGAAPVVRAVRAETPGIWRRQELSITFGCGRGEQAVWDGWATARCGAILGAAVEGQPPSADARWQLRTDGAPRSLRLAVLRADSPAPGDATILTLRTAQGSVSFRPADVALAPLYLPDLGVFIAGVDGPSYEEYARQIAPLRGQSIYDRVRTEPEQTAARAFAEIPPLSKTKQEPEPRYLPLGWDMNRQEFALLYNGDVFCDKQALKVGGRDTARLLWPGTRLRYRFATGDPPDFREREDAVQQRLRDGYLPIVLSTWSDREFLYEQTAFTAPLVEVTGDPLSWRGDEDLVLILRFQIRNRTEGTKRAQLWMTIEPAEELTLAGSEVVARGRVVPAAPVARQWTVQPYPRLAVRARIAPGPGGRLRAVPFPRDGMPWAIPGAVLYEAEVAEFGTHTVDVLIPFASLGDEPARARLQTLDVAAALAQVADYWRGFVAAGGQITTPDPLLNDFFKAAATHVAITVDRDPASGLFLVPAATYRYGTCANEACLQIRQLDWRGYHDRARAYLETFLTTQGWRPLDGRFRTQAGVLRGLDVYGDEVRSAFDYTLDHGFVMRQLAEHYWLTRDRAWVARWASHFVAACDFIIREREATKQRDADGERVPEYGLLPAGHLEDNPEWGYWYAVNAWAYGGLRDLAAVLAEVGHPEAERLQAEAEAYRRDILASLERARGEAPVVRLRDGTAIPHTPSRAGLRGRAWGWFREGAYGPLHLVDNDLLDPRSVAVTWILKDLEDNIFVSRAYGRPIDVERDWFSQGGVTIQANLLNNAIAYLRRDEIEHAVRAFFNNLAASLYPDVRCFTEHPVVELGHGVGPFYKTPDECGFLNWLRLFLIQEEGATLYLARGLPRSWLKDGDEVRVDRMATRFGLLSYRLWSEVRRGRISAEIAVPRRPTPEAIVLRLRHPTRAAIRQVRVDGAATYQVHADDECLVLRPAEEHIRVEAQY